MGGLGKVLPIEDAAIEAIRAGCGLIEICHRAELILQAFEALIAEAERSAAFRKLLLKRARVTGRKRLLIFPDRMQAALAERQSDALRARILRFGETVAAAQSPEGGSL
jgi:beta-N-acetylhexosaminidase